MYIRLIKSLKKFHLQIAKFQIQISICNFVIQLQNEAKATS